MQKPDKIDFAKLLGFDTPPSSVRRWAMAWNRKPLPAAIDDLAV